MQTFTIKECVCSNFSYRCWEVNDKQIDVFDEEQNGQLFEAAMELLFDDSYPWDTCVSVVGFLDMIVENIDCESVIHIIDRLVQLSCKELSETLQIVESFSSLPSFLEKINSQQIIEYLQMVIPQLIETEYFIIIVLQLVTFSSEFFSNALNNIFPSILDILDAALQSEENDDVNISGCIFITDANLDSSFALHCTHIIPLVFDKIKTENERLQSSALRAMDKLVRFVITQNDDIFNKICDIKDRIFDTCKNEYYTCLASSLTLLTHLSEDNLSTLVDMCTSCFDEEDLSDSCIGVLLLEGLMKREECTECVCHLTPAFLDTLYASHIDCYLIEASQLLYSALIEMGPRILDQILKFEAILEELSSPDQNTELRLSAMLPLAKIYKLKCDAENANAFFTSSFSLLESLRDTTIGPVTHSFTSIIPLLTAENVFTLLDFITENICVCSSSFVSDLLKLIQKVCKFRNEETTKHCIDSCLLVFQKIIDKEVAFRHEVIDYLFTETIFIAFCDFASVFFTTKIPQCKAILSFIISSIDCADDVADEALIENDILYPAIGSIADAVEQRIVDEQDISHIVDWSLSKICVYENIYVRHNLVYLLDKLNLFGILTKEHLEYIIPIIHQWNELYSSCEFCEDSAEKKSFLDMISTFLTHIKN